MFYLKFSIYSSLYLVPSPHLATCINLVFLDENIFTYFLASPTLRVCRYGSLILWVIFKSAIEKLLFCTMILSTTNLSNWSINRWNMFILLLHFHRLKNSHIILYQIAIFFPSWTNAFKLIFWENCMPNTCREQLLEDKSHTKIQHKVQVKSQLYISEEKKGRRDPKFSAINS